MIGYFISLVGKSDQEALVDAKIPEETKEFFRSISRMGGGINVDFIKKLTRRDFDNEEDFGKKTTNGFRILQDDNFIIYFRDKDSEKTRAQAVLKIAGEATEPLSSFFGNYFYPSAVEGRKLPIYLAVSRDDYYEICRSIGFNTPKWSAAVTSVVYDNTGKCICRGIVLGERVTLDAPDDMRKTLWHEMAHYVHFTAVDLTRKTEFFNWEYEGCASYFAGEKRSVPPDKEKVRNIKLTEQTTDYLDAYWVGDYFYHYIDSKLGHETVPRLIRESLTQSIISSTSSVMQMPFSDVENGWRNYCFSGMGN
jgi:hypothetical protein